MADIDSLFHQMQPGSFKPFGSCVGVTGVLNTGSVVVVAEVELDLSSFIFCISIIISFICLSICSIVFSCCCSPLFGWLPIGLPYGLFSIVLPLVSLGTGGRPHQLSVLAHCLEACLAIFTRYCSLLGSRSCNRRSW
ncbi:hypothetical protein EJ04DRAFT_13019 [Polyplosphaeria fusca]|uniref:Uncharacterized protein n=1 Tax=Polyplosphaeria fusca TaxID=682080 RepID=A0A9P4QUS5_9PLEO|nr:hypothetical protein EJ04DRAFT_13019 [Polyplosphaeria fusca]